ncbi:MAG: response regulator, partial [Acidobacteriota bacterium]
MSDHGSIGSDSLKGWRILVVDDEEDVRTFLLTVFADAGAEICEAGDGADAIRMAQTHRPDLITLDLSMPGHDGAAAFAE